jgi:hypothetical protein
MNRTEVTTPIAQFWVRSAAGYVEKPTSGTFNFDSKLLKVSGCYLS